MAKNLNLGNLWTISMSNISKLQIFLKNRINSNWRSYLVLTSDQKPKKLFLSRFWEKYQSFDFGLIWRPFSKYLQMRVFKNIRLCNFFIFIVHYLHEKNQKNPQSRFWENCVTNQPKKGSDFELIWRPFCGYLQINNFFQKYSSVTFLPL